MCPDMVLALGRGTRSEVVQFWHRGMWQPRTIFGCPRSLLHFLQKIFKLSFLKKRNTCYWLSSLLRPSLENMILSCPPKVLFASLFSQKAFGGEHGQPERWQARWEDDKLLPVLFLGDSNGFRLKCQSMSHCKSIFSLANKYLGRNSQAVTNAVLAIPQAKAAFGSQAWSKCSGTDGRLSASELTALSQN